MSDSAQHSSCASNKGINGAIDDLAWQLKLPPHVREALHGAERFTIEVSKLHGRVEVRYHGQYVIPGIAAPVG